MKNADILPNAVLTLKPDKIFQDGVSAELATAAIGSATVQESATSVSIPRSFSNSILIGCIVQYLGALNSFI